MRLKFPQESHAADLAGRSREDKRGARFTNILLDIVTIHQIIIDVMHDCYRCTEPLLFEILALGLDDTTESAAARQTITTQFRKTVSSFRFSLQAVKDRKTQVRGLLVISL